MTVRPPDNLCAVLLAAGEGRRLMPLTALRPKPLCPVGGTSLLERALDRLAAVGLSGPDAVAVNACHLAEQVVTAVGDRARLSVEAPPPLDTGGGVARLRDWTDGRDVLVCNADGYLSPGPDALRLLLSGWDRERPRLLVVDAPGRGDFVDPTARGDAPPTRTLRFAGASLAPRSLVAELPVGPSALSTAWRRAEAADRLDLVPFDGVFVDCGTVDDYLAANLHASDGRSVVGTGATVVGRLTRSVVWPGATVTEGEHLVDSVRAVLPDGSPLTVRATAGTAGR
ncbi:MAG: NTP transferase domain-containing protein [Actinocatenispora sp.]